MARHVGLKGPPHVVIDVDGGVRRRGQASHSHQRMKVRKLQEQRTRVGAGSIHQYNGLGQFAGQLREERSPCHNEDLDQVAVLRRQRVGKISIVRPPEHGTGRVPAADKEPLLLEPGTDVVGRLKHLGVVVAATQLLSYRVARVCIIKNT